MNKSYDAGEKPREIQKRQRVLLGRGGPLSTGPLSEAWEGKGQLCPDLREEPSGRGQEALSEGKLGWGGGQREIAVGLVLEGVVRTWV